ncbi:MAG: sensor domain-containing diguanylate cyclase [Negativicutes bacterium]|nr:sensor domain-containing diguanylate cyclase [Negativicutes bacterium]
MNEPEALRAMLNIMTEVLPAALAYVDKQGKISFIQSARRPDRSRFYQGKPLARFFGLLFRRQAEVLLSAFHSCSILSEPVDIKQFRWETSRNMIEYLNWRFVPAPQAGDVIISVCNVTENVAMEAEFAAISQQNEATNRELHAVISELDFRLMDLDLAYKKFAALYRITSVSQQTVNEQEVLDQIVDGIIAELGFTAAAILLLDEEKQELVLAANRGYLISNLRLPYEQGLTWRAVINRDMVYIPDVHKEPNYVQGGGNGLSEVAIPLIFADRIIGVLDIECSEDRPLRPYELNLLRTLAGQVALTISHAQHVAEVEVQAITDALTGHYNYRYFVDLLDREFKRALRYRRPLSLMMLDVDHFKKYNDTQGHVLGNEVLRQVAMIIKQNCRDVDFLVRYGGEEFAVLFPETGLSEAYLVAERIRAAVAEFPFVGRHVQPGGELTVSIGVAAYPQDSNTDKELLKHADTALYLAKRSRRNCVIYYPKPSSSKEKG